MAKANAWLKAEFWPRFNATFAVPAPEPGSAFVPLMGTDIKEILCLQEQRTVRPDNCITYRGKTLQIPAHKHRCHFVKAKVRVHEYPDESLAIFHGPRCLARYTAAGQPLDNGGHSEPVAQTPARKKRAA